MVFSKLVAKQHMSAKSKHEDKQHQLKTLERTPRFHTQNQGFQRLAEKD